ncbi:MAG: glycosyltransferase family 4 protein [Verrucomicrobia bacterium]|nr:glycosyltransferase family 4 protein [Verrucomicrobiota bacterium]
MLDPWDALPGEIGYERGLNVARALAEEGHEVVWWQSSFSHAEKRFRAKQFCSISLARGLTVFLLPTRAYDSNVSLARLVSIAGYVWQFMYKQRGQARPDAIMVSGPIFFLEPVLLYLRLREHIPIVFEFRDLWPESIINAASGVQRLARQVAFAGFRLLRQLLLHWCDGIVGLNASYLALARREAGVRSRARFAVAYPSPEMPTFRIGPPLRKPVGETWIVSSGALGVSHDYDTLLEVAALLRERRHDLRFLITGSGQQAANIRRNISERELTNVSFLGALPSAQFHALLHECDLGLALYRRFSTVVFPTKIVDYLLAGLGVVTSIQGEVAQVLVQAHAGFFTGPEDPVELAELLDRLTGCMGQLAILKQNAGTLARRFEHDRQIAVITDMLVQVAHARHVPGASA